ncbi:unnamed protein product, partial [Polarella glacialis]
MASPQSPGPGPGRAFASTQRLSPLELLVVGGAAGAGAKTITAPLDRIRLFYQVTPSATFSLRGAAQLAVEIGQRAGVEGLYRGHTATLAKAVPYAALQFYVYDAAMLQLGVADPVGNAAWSSTSKAAAAGAAAASFATIATYPLDVMRTRLMLHVGQRNYLLALEQVLQAEGHRALYRGMGPTLLGVVPYGALSFSTFEAIKVQLRRRHGAAADGSE